jgi:hypothetical protein
MANVSVGRLARAARRGLKLLGWPGVAGVGLLVFCGAAYLSAVAPAHRAMEQAHQRALLLQGKTGREGGGLRTAPDEQLAAFYKFFPSGMSEPDWLEQIYQAAKEQDLALDRGDYRPVRERVGRLTRYQVTLPVRGSYPQIRKFLAAVLSEVPIVSLDGVDFARQKIGEDTVEARVRLSLFLRQT